MPRDLDTDYEAVRALVEKDSPTHAQAFDRIPRATVLGRMRRVAEEVAREESAVDVAARTIEEGDLIEVDETYTFEVSKIVRTGSSTTYKGKSGTNEDMELTVHPSGSTFRWREPGASWETKVVSSARIVGGPDIAVGAQPPPAAKPRMEQVVDELVRLGWDRSSGGDAEITVRGGPVGGATNPEGKRTYTAEHVGPWLMAARGMNREDMLAKVMWRDNGSAASLAAELFQAVQAATPGKRAPEPTTKLLHGHDVLAKPRPGNPDVLDAVTYANRTQAQKKVDELGAGDWWIAQWGRPFFVVRRKPEDREPVKTDPTKIPELDDYSTWMWDHTDDWPHQAWHKAAEAELARWGFVREGSIEGQPPGPGWERQYTRVGKAGGTIIVGAYLFEQVGTQAKPTYWAAWDIGGGGQGATLGAPTVRGVLDALDPYMAMRSMKYAVGAKPVEPAGLDELREDVRRFLWEEGPLVGYHGHESKTRGDITPQESMILEAVFLEDGVAVEEMEAARKILAKHRAAYAQEAGGFKVGDTVEIGNSGTLGVIQTILPRAKDTWFSIKDDRGVGRWGVNSFRDGDAFHHGFRVFGYPELVDSGVGEGQASDGPEPETEPTPVTMTAREIDALPVGTVLRETSAGNGNGRYWIKAADTLDDGWHLFVKGRKLTTSFGAAELAKPGKSWTVANIGDPMLEALDDAALPAIWASATGEQESSVEPERGGWRATRSDGQSRWFAAKGDARKWSLGLPIPGDSSGHARMGVQEALTDAQWKALDDFAQSGGHGYGEDAYLTTATAQVLERAGLVILSYRKIPGRARGIAWGEATFAGLQALAERRAGARSAKEELRALLRYRSAEDLARYQEQKGHARMAVQKGKPNLEEVANNFVGQFSHRDAIAASSGYGRDLTGEMMAEVAWELGYENEPWDDVALGSYVELGRSLGIDLRAEYEKGRRDGPSGGGHAAMRSGALAPVDPYLVDLQDSGPKVTEATILADYAPRSPKGTTARVVDLPLADLPSPELAEDQDPEGGGYDWSTYTARATYPAPKILRDGVGELHILDGNHRLTYFAEAGYTMVPVWLIEEPPAPRRKAPAGSEEVLATSRYFAGREFSSPEDARRSLAHMLRQGWPAPSEAEIAKKVSNYPLYQVGREWKIGVPLGKGSHAAMAAQGLPSERTRRQRIKAAALAGERGRFWYQDAQKQINAVAKAWGVDPVYVAAAVAATSPATPVISSARMKRGGGGASNIGKARKVVKRESLFGHGSEALHDATPGLSRLKLFEACQDTGGAPADCLEVAFPSPDSVKTHAFVRNLLGYPDPVTVDSLVARTVAGKPIDVTEARHRQIGEDIRAVARQLGWEPREVMAAVWTAAGGTGDLHLATRAELEATSRGRW